jgi:iron(III) transport system substrate-binding protein
VRLPAAPGIKTRRAFIGDRTIVVLGIAAVIFLTLWRVSSLKRNDLVVYCAHDSVFADGIIKEYERLSRQRVVVKYDTEATKSLGLVELLIGEKEAPRCDVFWNNELLGTVELAERGILAEYRGPGWERIPAAFRDPQGRWAGFAARLRVVATNIKSVPVGTAPPDSPDRWTIAKPLYGTTLTHFTVLWHKWGRERTQQWHRDQRARGIRVVNGNGAVKDAVAAGVCAAGYTDTDDFFDAKDAGAPVEMVPVEIEGGTVCIPNTVAVIRGTSREILARQFADYLLSADTELALAKSKSRQIPLGPVDEAELPAEVRDLRAAAQRGIPLNGLLGARRECLAWLKSEYTE